MDDLSKLKNSVASLQEEVRVLRSDTFAVVSRFTDLLDRYAQMLDSALSSSQTSLSASVLQNVLLPIVMRLFSFFALLVVALTGAILGLRWIFTGIFHNG